MTHATPQYSTFSVSGSIKLGQFLKLTGLVDNGAEARIAIQSGDVTVNGATETRRGHSLFDGDLVVINCPTGQLGAVVEQLGPGDTPGSRADADNGYHH